MQKNQQQETEQFQLLISDSCAQNPVNLLEQEQTWCLCDPPCETESCHPDPEHDRERQPSPPHDLWS